DLGGGFGSKGPTGSHVVLAAMAARRVNRPVKRALRRPQTFGPVGFRSRTREAIALGARRDGTLTAVRHDTIAQTSSFDEFMEPASVAARMPYASPSIATSHKLVRSDIGTPSYMRAPGWAPGSYALECALDELAGALDMDPLALRLKNYADQDPDTHRPWSSKTLRECYRVGAERFGWNRRPRAPRAQRDGRALLGWGMATSVYATHRSKAAALAVGDARSPLHGLAAGDVGVADGRLSARGAAGRGETLQALAARHGEIEAGGEARPGDEEKQFAMYAFGAQFAEVRIDADLGM